MNNNLLNLIYLNELNKKVPHKNWIVQNFKDFLKKIPLFLIKSPTKNSNDFDLITFFVN